MSNNHYTYMGPGSNILPAVQYLRSKGATSESKAISLKDIESEDIKQLLKLNGQASMWIGVTPEGKYWVRFNLIAIFLIIFIFFIIGIITVAIITQLSFPSRFNQVQNEIKELRNEIVSE